MFLESEAHKEVLWQSCLLKVMYEILAGKADGFVMRRSRILSREGSLTGTEPPNTKLSLPPTPTPTDAAANTPGSVKSPVQKNDPDSGSSDESSD